MENINQLAAGLLRDYAADVAARVVRTDFETLGQIAADLIAAKERGATVFTAGNGGSGATASHMCNDLVKGCRVHGREGFRAQCLVDSSPIMTCLANDFSYDDVFAIQLRTFARRGDIFIGFSGSGNSENVLRAAKAAKELGMLVIGFSGRDGGKLAPLCDRVVIAPTDSMEQLEDMHMLYEHALVCIMHGILQDRWGVEYINYPDPERHFTAALFDFDGTVSLIREGWREIMIPYFTEVLSALNTGESPEALRALVADFVDKLTGKQTIFQCMRLDEEVQKRGGAACDPLVYKQEYLRRLGIHIADRVKGLENGSIAPEALLVPGAKEFLKALQAAGIRCYLASGTDEVDVLREARLLGVDQYFDGGVHGARDEILECSKELVIRDLLENGDIKPHQLLSFGDGYVEIELVKNVGGYSFGVASDEARKKGINEWKRQRLTAAGADAIIPDFTGYARIIHDVKEGI